MLERVIPATGINDGTDGPRLKASSSLQQANATVLPTTAVNVATLLQPTCVHHITSSASCARGWDWMELVEMHWDQADAHTFQRQVDSLCGYSTQNWSRVGRTWSLLTHIDVNGEFSSCRSTLDFVLESAVGVPSVFDHNPSLLRRITTHRVQYKGRSHPLGTCRKVGWTKLSGSFIPNIRTFQPSELRCPGHVSRPEVRRTRVVHAECPLKTVGMSSRADPIRITWNDSASNCIQSDCTSGCDSEMTIDAIAELANYF